MNTKGQIVTPVEIDTLNNLQIWLMKELDGCKTKSEKAYSAGFQFEHEYWSGRADATRDTLNKILDDERQ